MSVLVATELGKYFGAQDVFSGVSVRISKSDRIALVGPNGVGKTTLLRILAGLEEPSSGEVQTARGLRIGYLPQEPELRAERTLYEEMLAAYTDLLSMQGTLREMEKCMGDPEHADRIMERYAQLTQKYEAAGGYTYESQIRMVLTGLGFREEQFHSPLGVLSGGQGTRAFLGRLLLEAPDVLLLDEPTNYLDVEALEWFESYLAEWTKSLVVVAHDRYFLDVVASRVWDMQFGRLEEYRGNYSQYVEEKAERLARRTADYEAQQKVIEKTEDFIRRYKAGQRTKEARGRETRLERMERLERPREMRTMGLSLQSHGRTGQVVLSTSDVQIGYRTQHGKNEPSVTLFACPDLRLYRGERVALLGPNGSGKTTFLRTAMGDLPPVSGKISHGHNVRPGYLAQAYAQLNSELTVLDQILDVKNLPLGQARSLLGRYLFSGDAVFKRIGDLSGGEKARVALAMLTLRGANFLLLDEPTTHLDLESQEVLEDVLRQYEGTLILVTHDRYLVNSVATQVWDIREERMWTYDGNYTDYLMARERDRLLAENGQPTPHRDDAARRSSARAGGTARHQVSQRIAELEQIISGLEARLMRLEKNVVEAGHGKEVGRLQQLSREYQVVQAELERSLEEWSELSAELRAEEV